MNDRRIERFTSGLSGGDVCNRDQFFFGIELGHGVYRHPVPLLDSFWLLGWGWFDRKGVGVEMGIVQFFREASLALRYRAAL